MALLQMHKSHENHVTVLIYIPIYVAAGFIELLLESHVLSTLERHTKIQIRLSYSDHACLTIMQQTTLMVELSTFVLLSVAIVHFDCHW